MRMLMAALALLAVAVPAVAGDWKPVVLIATAVEVDGNGNIVVHLTSGNTLTIAKEDWSQAWSSALEQAIASQEQEGAARSDSDPPSDSEASAMIRAKCAEEWPDDFQMRKYCQDKHLEGLGQLRARSMAGQLATIRSKCARDWPDDFVMRNYCEEQQLEALRELNR